MLDGRDKPIITCLEYIREYLMKRIVTVQEVMDKWEGFLTPTATGIFENIKKAASDIIVTWNGDSTYQCNGPWDDQCVVDMKLEKCACRRWELTGIPCRHAVAVMWNMVQHRQREAFVPEEQVHKAYWMQSWKEVYSNKIVPTNGIEYWPRSGCPTKLAPPFHHTQVGRPKKKRTRGLLEKKSVVKAGKVTKQGKSVTCSKCGVKGHNVKTCEGVGIQTGSEVGASQRAGSQAGASQRGGSEAGASQHGTGGSQVCGSKRKGSATQGDTGGSKRKKPK